MDTKRKTPKAFRLSNQGESLLSALADHLGVNQTAVIEMAIRRMAKDENVSSPLIAAVPAAGQGADNG